MNMPKRIFAFGEIMLRQHPIYQGERISSANVFRVEPGGSESNTAIGLSNLGEKVSLISYLPENPVAENIIRYLKKNSVDVSWVKRMEQGRVGIYWTENGVSIRPSSVIYDREFSSFSFAGFDPSIVHAIATQGKWFHSTGITAGLNRNLSMILIKYYKVISQKVSCSIDLNFRNKLWRFIRDEKERYKIMNACVKECSLVLGNEEDFQKCLGINGAGGIKLDIYRNISTKVFSKFKNVKYVAVSIRTSFSASRNGWQGYLFYRNGSEFISPEYTIEPIVDRVGSGDSFSAGIIYGILNKHNPIEIINRAVAFSALKHTTIGDTSDFSNEDIDMLLKTKGTGRIVR